MYLFCIKTKKRQSFAAAYCSPFFRKGQALPESSGTGRAWQALPIPSHPRMGIDLKGFIGYNTRNNFSGIAHILWLFSNSFHLLPALIPCFSRN